MATINLRPWREERRERLQKEFVQLTSLVLIAALGVWFAWNQVVSGWVEHQQSRNNVLSAEIKELDKKVDEIKQLREKKKDLIARMKVIQDLQGTRPMIVYIFDELAKTIPDGVYYTMLERKGMVISIEGTAESNQRVSNLMRNLDQSDWFADPNLTKIIANPAFGEQGNDFHLTVKISPSQDEAADEAGSQAGQ